ncbi:MAG: hypothetical protein AAFX58_04945 [Pseudomonadota bacterium]
MLRSTFRVRWEFTASRDDEPLRGAAMLHNADLIVTARDTDSDGQLVGVSRCITDFAFCCYCSDLAVDAAEQTGIRPVETDQLGVKPALRSGLWRRQPSAGPVCVTIDAAAGSFRVPAIELRNHRNEATEVCRRQ